MGVVNESGGLFDLVHRSADFNGHNFTQQAGGTLGLDVDADQTSKLNVATAQLDGTLAVRTSTPTATGHQRILDATTRTGTFAATNFTGPAWTVGYDATGAFLDPAPAGGGGGDTTPPAETLSGKKSQKLGSTITVTVSCDEDCTATGTGTMSVPKLAKVYKLKKATKAVAAGGKVKLKLKVPKKAGKAAKKALKRHKSVKAKLHVLVKDAAGNTASKNRTIKLKLK